MGQFSLASNARDTITGVQIHDLQYTVYVCIYGGMWGLIVVRALMRELTTHWVNSY